MKTFLKLNNEILSIKYFFMSIESIGNTSWINAVSEKNVTIFKVELSITNLFWHLLPNLIVNLIWNVNQEKKEIIQ